MMVLAAARVMLLQLRRDRAALILTFALPPLIFVILAAIFAGATGTELRLHVGVVDLSNSASGRRLMDALQTQTPFRVTAERGDEASLAGMVRDGEVDVGVLIRADLQPGSGAAAAEPPILVIGEASRAVATPIVIGQVQRAFNERLPDVVLARVIADVERSGRIDADERAFLDQAFEQNVRDGGAGFSFSSLVAQREATRGALAGGPVAYYAGAVTALFLLFAAMQGAASLLDERQAGIHARLLAGPNGLGAVVVGKFLFLTGQGLMQTLLIYAVAAAAYHVDVLARPGPWFVTAVVASATAAALGLAVNAACSTRQQAHMVANFGVLVLSAVGGSMVPRFLMPPWLQSLSWLTPNGWIIDAFGLSLRRDTDAHALVVAWAVLIAVAVAGLFTGRTVAGRRSHN